jgi:translation initiation factor IF-3
MDYGKFKFDEAQRAKESKRKSVHVGIKEMKYRPKIGPGDFDTKTRQVGKFLDDGHKVKITIMFRGREVFHPELGKRILDRIAEQMEGTAKVESEARLDGRNMVMVLAPDKRARQAAAAKGDAPAAEPEAGARRATGRHSGPTPSERPASPPAAAEAAPDPASARSPEAQQPAAAPQSAASPTGPPPGEG